MSTPIIALEDRILILKDQVDSLQKDFDPNQPRASDGKWTDTGAGGTPGSKLPAETQIAHVRDAKGWVTVQRVSSAVNATYERLKPKAKEALGHAVATAVTYYSKSGSDYDSVQASVTALAETAGVHFDEAKASVIGVLEKLKELRMKDLNKAADDPVIKLLDKTIAELRKLNVDVGQTISKIEDRVLELRDEVDQIKAGRK